MLKNSVRMSDSQIACILQNCLPKRAIYIHILPKQRVALFKFISYIELKLWHLIHKHCMYQVHYITEF